MKLILFVITILFTTFVSAALAPVTATTVPNVAHVTLPHTFTLDEMSTIMKNLRTCLWQLELFRASAGGMSATQLQEKLQQVVWPLFQCLNR